MELSSALLKVSGQMLYSFFFGRFPGPKFRNTLFLQELI